MLVISYIDTTAWGLLGIYMRSTWMVYEDWSFPGYVSHWQESLRCFRSGLLV